jgi:SET domain-containing protein
MYKPLPNYLTIKTSDIEGLGLFTTEDIDNKHILGITHVSDHRFEDGYIRTPLGGFFNHSETPNCKIITDGDYLMLQAITNIKAGEEITAYYTLYNPTK